MLINAFYLFRCNSSKFWDTSDPSPTCSKKKFNLLFYFGNFLCLFFLFIQENKKTNMESCSNVNDECYTAKGLSCQSKDGSNMCL